MVLGSYMGVVLPKSCSSMFARAGTEVVVCAEENVFDENDQPCQSQRLPRVGFAFQSCEYETDCVLVG
jgi:hypothetical protein